MSLSFIENLEFENLERIINNYSGEEFKMIFDRIQFLESKKNTPAPITPPTIEPSPSIVCQTEEEKRERRLKALNELRNRKDTFKNISYISCNYEDNIPILPVPIPAALAPVAQNIKPKLNIRFKITGPERQPLIKGLQSIENARLYNKEELIEFSNNRESIKGKFPELEIGDIFFSDILTEKGRKVLYLVVNKTKCYITFVNILRIYSKTEKHEIKNLLITDDGNCRNDLYYIKPDTINTLLVTRMIGYNHEKYDLTKKHIGSNSFYNVEIVRSPFIITKNKISGD